MIVRHNAHPVLMLETWLKEAQEAQRPAGMSDVRRRTSVGKNRQEYTQPNPPVAVTDPNTISSQKALSPPPVM
jgi:hypothetical protein